MSRQRVLQVKTYLTNTTGEKAKECHRGTNTESFQNIYPYYEETVLTSVTSSDPEPTQSCFSPFSLVLHSCSCGFNTSGAYTILGYCSLADLKKTLAVLLDNIMLRLGRLESKVDNIFNGTGGNLTNGTSTATPGSSNAEKVNVAGKGEQFPLLRLLLKNRNSFISFQKSGT